MSVNYYEDGFNEIFNFHSVLVDAPCTNDRLSVNSDEDNIFATGKTREREYLPEYQALLLFNAYSMVKPGGFVVYSTCSLSPSRVRRMPLVMNSVATKLLYYHSTSH